MGHRSISFVKENFALNNVLTQYVELYRDVLERWPSASYRAGSRVLPAHRAKSVLQFDDGRHALDPLSDGGSRDAT
jgi:hypothetical protein